MTTQIKAYREKQKRDSAHYLKSVGYESPIFTAKFKGGKCGLCDNPITLHAEVAYFLGKLSHVPCINQAIRERDQCQTCKGVHLIMTDSGIIPCPNC